MKFVCFLILVFAQLCESKAQTLLKVGPTAAINISSSVPVIPSIGTDFALEFRIKQSKISVNLIGTAQFGATRTDFYPKLWQKLLLVGGQTEFRYFLSGIFSGKYYGISFGFDYFELKNFTPPTAQYPVETLIGGESHFGITYGKFITNTSSKYYFNPFVYAGFSSSELSEYEIRFKGGIMIGRKR